MSKKPKFELVPGNHTREHCDSKDPTKYIYVLTSISASGVKATWSFWSTFDKAIKGLRAFTSNGKVSFEFYSEQLYYRYLVIEKVALDTAIHQEDPSETVWFEFTSKKVNKKGWVMEYGCERCDCPETYKGVMALCS